MIEYICSILPKITNAAGLAFDIIGVLLLWKFGLPEFISREGHDYLITEEINGAEKEKAKKYDKYAKGALIFIVIGFALQFISDFL